MGTFCLHNALQSKSFLKSSPSNINFDNAAGKTQEEVKIATATAAVAAGEDPAPAKFINGAPDEMLILPCQALKGDF